MTTTPTNHARLIRRLTPLYVAAFLQGLVLWYAVEKLFMTSIGFSAATIGLMAAAYSVVMLVIDTPAGIIADRWSRKGMLIIGSLLLAASSLICGLSQSIPIFIIGASLWGIFFACYSGMYDSIMYDTLSEEEGHSEHFERYYGRIRILDSSALILGSLIGGFLGSYINLRISFFATIPIALAAIIPLLMFKEPQLHKHAAASSMAEHIRSTVGAVIKRGSLVRILIVLILGSFITDMIFEFDQLWLLGTGAPTSLYGPANALILATIGCAGLLAQRLKLTRLIVVVTFIILTTLAALATIVVNNTMIIVGSLFIVCLACLSLDISYLRQLHDRLPAQVRSGSSSAVNTIARAFFVIGALLFGWLTQEQSVFAAAWLIAVPVLAICLFVILPFIRPTPPKKSQTEV